MMLFTEFKNRYKIDSQTDKMTSNEIGNFLIEMSRIKLSIVS